MIPMVMIKYASGLLRSYGVISNGQVLRMFGVIKYPVDISWGPKG
jgi:hypothetical protein